MPKICLICSLLLSLFIFSGCGSDSETADSGEKVFRYGTTAYGVEMGNTGLNPHSDYSGWSAVRYGIGETLFKFNDKMELEPWLAAGYEQLDDYTVKITLKDGIKFSSGRALDGQAVKQCLEHLIAVHDRAPGDLKIQEITADGQTVTIKSAEKVPALLNYLSDPYGAIIDMDYGITDERNVAGTGPFIATKISDTEIALKKNPNYWNADAIKLGSIKALLMEDPNAAYSAYQTGEALLIKDVPTEEIASLDGNAEFYISPTLGTYYLSVNTQRDAFKDPRVRQALSLAIDRKYVADAIMGGVYTAAGNLLGTGVADWDGSEFKDNANGGKPYIDVENHAANVARAKELMAEAGYPNGEGYPIITYSTNDAGFHKAVAEYLQQAWKELGITLNVEVVEWSSFTPLRRAGEYDAARNGWLFDYNDPTNMLDLFYSTNGNNDGKYNNPEYDALLDAARNTLDPQARFAILHQAEDLIMADAGMIPVAWYNDFYLMSNKVTGWWHSPYGYWYVQYADIAE